MLFSERSDANRTQRGNPLHGRIKSFCQDLAFLLVLILSVTLSGDWLCHCPKGNRGMCSKDRHGIEFQQFQKNIECLTLMGGEDLALFLVLILRGTVIVN